LEKFGGQGNLNGLINNDRESGIRLVTIIHAKGKMTNKAMITMNRNFNTFPGVRGLFSCKSIVFFDLDILDLLPHHKPLHNGKNEQYAKEDH
jgi:hypothetical protein